MPLFDGFTSPGEAIRERLKSFNWTQHEFALILGRSLRAVSDLIAGKSSLTPEMAVAVAAAFGDEPEEWLRLEIVYRLSSVTQDTDRIRSLAQTFTRAPVREMQRRGWIKETQNPAELQAELDEFFGDGELSVSTKRTMTLPDLNLTEVAWCHRAKNLAQTMMASPFAEDRISKAKSELRKLAGHPKGARHIAPLLAGCGVRFLVVEPLPGAHIDGATFWDEFGPVVALSIRHDRMDAFWFTLMHELSHVRHHDPISVDRGLVDIHGVIALSNNEVEERANREAGSSLIAEQEIQSFISRVGPLYSRERIVQFANRLKIHPAIIVGQLQHRKQIGFAALREFLVKVREVVVSTTLTDGWGHVISPGVKRRKVTL